MYLEAERLIIRDLEESMASDVHLNSQNEENRRFVPDEVFETEKEARTALRHLITCYQKQEGPFVYAILLKEGPPIGHVQLVRTQESWEVGFHIATSCRNRGYATEAVRAFLPLMMEALRLEVVYGVCDAENPASGRVLEKCGFNLLQECNGLSQGRVRRIRKYVRTRRSPLS